MNDYANKKGRISTFVNFAKHSYNYSYIFVGFLKIFVQKIGFVKFV